VWVVDNASTDGSVEAVRVNYPQVHIISNAKNIGFAAANNQAIAASAGRYVLLLNSDTVVQPGALEDMCAYLETQPEVGAVGSRLLNADGTTQRSCWRGYPGLGSALIDGLYLWRLFPSLVIPDEVGLVGHQRPQDVDHLLGACILTRRKVIEQVGLLNDGYYLFFEETDWCRRIRNSGWRIIYLPEPRIVHFGQQSMRQIPERTLPSFYASFCRFVRRNGGRWTGLRLLALKVIIAVSVVIRLALWSTRLRRDSGLSRRMLGGYGRVLRRLPSL